MFRASASQSQHPFRRAFDMLLTLWEILWTFTQIALASFGGPAASIALMQRAIVERRKWLTQTEFLDFVAVSHIIPGPIAVQLSLHLGYRRGGPLGAFAAVVGFVVPAAAITWAIAVLYQRNQGLPALEACLGGIRPAVLAIVLTSLWQIARKLPWTRWRIALLTTVVGLNLMGFDPIILMVFAIAIGSLYHSLRVIRSRVPKERQQDRQQDGSPKKPTDNTFASFLIPSLAAFSQAGLGMKSLYLYGMFFKIGLLLYGGGNILAAYIQSDFVNHGLLSHAQFLDALAVGQSTPGPVLTVATFVGYLLAGHLGAVSATLGIITPCVFLAGFTHQFMARARNSESVSTILNIVNLVVVGLILSVCISLAIWVFQDVVSIAVALCVGGLILLFDVPPIVAIIGAAVVGWLL